LIKFIISARLLLPILLVFLTGCDTMSYYRHLAGGQMRIMSARQPIESLIADPDTDERLRERLKLVNAIREFARTELHLPVEGQFIYYADHGRPVAVWNVYATPEFSMAPKTWCFPVAGCTIYKGFFDEQKALKFADGLKNEGYDVHVGGAGGYSTLGWFSDPIFQNILNRNGEHIAAYIFHELAHKQLYIKGDTAFNEGFAVAVEQEGVRRWLASRNEIDLFDQYRQQHIRRIEFSSLVQTTRTGLSNIYSSPDLDIMKTRQQKAYIIGKMHTDYRQLQKTWNGYGTYDRWFDLPINNARLILFAAYHDHAPAFSNMIRAAGGDMETFYSMAEKLSQQPREKRNQTLRAYSSIKTAANASQPQSGAIPVSFGKTDPAL
jgi:predicted aminopeptidase